MLSSLSDEALAESDKVVLSVEGLDGIALGVLDFLLGPWELSFGV